MGGMMSSDQSACNNSAGRDQFDIKNHVDYESHMKQHMKKSDCIEMVKKTKALAHAQLRAATPTTSAAPTQTDDHELNRCKEQVKELARALKKQHDIEQDSRYLELKKKVRALELGLSAEKKHETCKQLGDYRVEDHPEYTNRIAELKKKHQLELEMARTEVELSWKKKMYTDIKSHPQYESLVQGHEMKLKMLEQELQNNGASIKDVSQNPEYRRLMQKYVDCKENKHKRGYRCGK